MNRPALLFFFLVLLVHTQASAQQGGAALRMATGVGLDFGGSGRIEASRGAGTSTSLGASPSLRLHADYELQRFLSLGAFSRLGLWEADRVIDHRSTLIDVGPRLTVHHDFRDFRFYLGLGAGLTLSTVPRDRELGLRNPAYGAALSVGPGLEYWFADRVGLFVEGGFSGHYFRHRADTETVRVSMSQVALTVGASFALTDPMQGRPRRDAAADDRRARRHFEAGKEAYDHGLYRRALGSFHDAYELSPRPLLLFNIAKAEDKLGQLAEARSHYRMFVSALPGNEHVAEVTRRIAEIDAQLGSAPASLTPAQAALLSAEMRRVVSEPALRLESAGPERSERVHKTWWFWAAVGSVVMAGTGTALLVAL